jgi:hypothetical protein
VLATNDGWSTAGTFAVTGDVIRFDPDNFYQAAQLDPAGNSYYALLYARYSDGVNASPYAKIRVLYLGADHYSEGIPDDWRLQWFGSADPNAGPKRHANDDFDGDGLSNLQEFLLGSNPTNKSSNLRFTSLAASNVVWQAKGYELYQLYSSSNLTTWAPAGNPVLATNFVGTNFVSGYPTMQVFNYTNGAPRQFYRVLKVP